MKIVIITFNGSYFPDSALNFAVQLNKMQPILVTGVYIPQTKYSYLWSDMNTLVVPAIPILEEVPDDEAGQNVERFKMFCQNNNLKYGVHRDLGGIVLPELIDETRFADLLIISSEKFYESLNEEDLNNHMKDVFHTAECPVVVVPETFHFPQRNILLYDGSASSVHAIKQFAYLLPELCDNETLLIFFREAGVEKMPDENYIEELVGQHYTNLSLLKLNINPKKYLTSWLDEEKNAILISGSFGRTMLSQFFRKSFVAEVIAEHKLPLFIAHT